jgi:hypothetical protein
VAQVTLTHPTKARNAVDFDPRTGAAGSIVLEADPGPVALLVSSRKRLLDPLKCAQGKGKRQKQGQGQGKG